MHVCVCVNACLCRLVRACSYVIVWLCVFTCMSRVCVCVYIGVFCLDIPRPAEHPSHRSQGLGKAVLTLERRGQRRPDGRRRSCRDKSDSSAFVTGARMASSCPWLPEDGWCVEN